MGGLLLTIVVSSDRLHTYNPGYLSMEIEFPPSCEHSCRVVGFEDIGQQGDIDRQDKP